MKAKMSFKHNGKLYKAGEAYDGADGAELKAKGLLEGDAPEKKEAEPKPKPKKKAAKKKAAE